MLPVVALLRQRILGSLCDDIANNSYHVVRLSDKSEGKKMTRLGSDDLRFLNAVRLLGAEGLTESAMAERLGMRAEELRSRVARIRAAFVSLTELAALATGERPAGGAREWEVTIEEREPVAA
jgi:hypothetical protein